MAIWGFAIGSGESILSVVPVNTEDSVRHAAIGVAGILAAALSAGARQAGPARG